MSCEEVHLVFPGLTMIHDINSEVGFAGGTPPLQAWSFLPVEYKMLHHYDTSMHFHLILF